MLDQAKPKTAILVGGEYRLRITSPGGQGGRNQQAALEALSMINDKQTFISIASDGLDNGQPAGAIIDSLIRKKLTGHEQLIKRHLTAFNPYPLLQQLDTLIMTGPTQSNVSDLALLLTE